jgi:hypothetical protein
MHAIKLSTSSSKGGRLKPVDRRPVIVSKVTGGNFEMHAWMRVFALLATVALSDGLPASYAADVFPEFDYVGTCKTDQPDSAGTGETLGKCTDEERRAKQQLARVWSQFAPDEKTQCIKETNIDGMPSYVELQICLQMTSDTRARVRNGQGHLSTE